MVRLQPVWHYCWHLPVHLWPSWGAQCDTGMFLLSLQFWKCACVYARVCGMGGGCNCCCRTQRRHLTHLISWPGAPLTLFVCSLSIKCIHAHTRREGMTHIRCTMSCTQIDAAAVSRVESHTHTHQNTHRYTLPEDYKHHFVGHQERCFFAVKCAWPVMRRFAVNILSLQITTSHWPSVYKPAAGKPRPSRRLHLGTNATTYWSPEGKRVLGWGLGDMAWK